MQYAQHNQQSHQGNMKPISAKELEYIVDSISNEDLLIKQCAATAAMATTPGVQQTLTHMIGVHQQHMNVLLHTLQQHTHMAPTSPQQSQ